jgi:hypothetical protein
MIVQPSGEMFAFGLDAQRLESSRVAAPHPQRKQLVYDWDAVIACVPLHQEVSSRPLSCSRSTFSKKDHPGT